MADPVRFDLQSARRIADTVYWKESQTREVTGSRKGPGRWITGWRLGRNVSGEDIPPFSCVAVSGGSEVDEQFRANLSKPSTSFVKCYGFTGSETIPDGEPGGYRFDPIWAAYDAGTPATEEGWGPKPGQFTLSKGYPGAIVTALKDTTSKIVEVSVCFPLVALLGKTTGSITANSASTSWQIYAGTLGSETATSFTAPAAISRINLNSGIWIKCTWVNNGWLMEPLEC